MDEELKNLKKYLYVLCKKIAGIKTINAGIRKDGKDAFTKEYKLYFLLFVHRLNGYKNLKTINGLPTITELDLINKINGLIDIKKSSVNTDGKITAAKQLLEASRYIIAKEKRLRLLPQFSNFQEENQKVLNEIRDAKLIVEKAKVANDKKEKEYDDIIDSLISHLGNITGKEIRTPEYLNNYLYKTTERDPKDGKFKIEQEIYKVKNYIDGASDLTQYFTFINTIIHNINPKNTSSNVKEYVNKYFVKNDITLQIRKAFMIYLINNIIYYYIILNYDRSDCDEKIRFIFYNRYIKFSKIAMVAPQKNGQYTVLNNDIIEIFRNRTLLFDLTNNIIHYEHEYLSKCVDYNESIKRNGIHEQFENQDALKAYNDISTDYEKAYTEYEKAYAEYVNVLATKNVDKTTAENNLRNAVYNFNENLFCCFSKYIEIHFKNKIIGITDKHKERISTYVVLIEKYNSTCEGCSIPYTDVKQKDELNSLKDLIESVMTKQIDLLFHFKDESKDTMNDFINMVIEIEKNIQDIYDELLYPSIEQDIFDKKDKISFLEDKYHTGDDSSIMTYNQMMREIIAKLKETKYYNNKALSTIYETLGNIVSKIGIPSLTFDILKGCCLPPLFMDRDAFINGDNTNISSIIYDKAIEDIERLIEAYKGKHSNTSESNDRHLMSAEYSIKIKDYLTLVEEIKEVEIDANAEKLKALKLLELARTNARKAYERTEGTKRKIDAIDGIISNRIRIAQEALIDEEGKYQRYLQLIKPIGQQEPEIRYDSYAIRKERERQIENCNENIKSIEDKKRQLDVLIGDAFRVAKDAKHKAYIYDKDDKKLADLYTIEAIKERLNNATTDAGDAIRKNEEADDILKEIERLLGNIRPDIIFVNGLTSHIKTLFNEDEKRKKEEDEKRKSEAIDSVSKAIDIGKAIGVAQNKHEDEERKREEEQQRKNEAIEGVSVAINVGDAIGVAQDKHDDEQRKNEAIDSVSKAIDVGKAIGVVQDKHEDEQRKNEANDGVRVAIRVGDAIRDVQNKHEEEERKNEANDGVGVAIRVGDAIDDARNNQEEVVNDPESEEDEEEGDEEEGEEGDEPEPNVIDVQETPVIAREYKIDDEVLKGRYLATGLFKEAKDEDIRMARNYQMEQVRNRYKKRGSINEMTAAIDEYNYPQMGGSGNTGDILNKLNKFENNINNPIEVFEIKFEDRLVFIIATFFIRYVSMSIIQRGIDSNMVKTFYEGFIYYGVIYTLLFWFMVLFINIDNNYTIDYIEINNLAIYIRSIFYYFYMGTNGISRLAIHTLLILVIIIIPILLNIKNGKAKDTADTLNDDEEDEVKLLPLEERTKLSKALSLFTLFIWILTSIIASKF